jgi:hypothetical protein
MSSSFSYLDNQNKKFRVTVSVPPFVASTSSWMVTVNPIPSFCRIDKITLIASGTPSSTTINLSVLNDGAGWAAASGNPAKSPFIEGVSSAVMANNLAQFTFTGGLYYRDSYRTNCLYLNFANNSFTAGDTFTVVVEGVQMSPYSIADNDLTPFIGDNTWRILRVDSSNNVYDLTQQLSRNNNPYGLGSTLENSESFTAFGAASDYLYIGSQRAWSSALFLVPSYSQNRTAVTFATTADGSTWNTTTNIQDNTSNIMNTVSSLSYSGVIKVTSWSGAAPVKLSFDPMTVAENNYNDFTQNIARPGGYFNNPARYWLRMKFAALTPSALKLVGILPVR